MVLRSPRPQALYDVIRGVLNGKGHRHGAIWRQINAIITRIATRARRLNPHLRLPHMILLHGQKTLQIPGHHQRQNQDHRRPDHPMHPKWRLIGKINPHSRPHDNGAQHHQNGHHEPIAGINPGKIQAAICAARRYPDPARKQRAKPTARAAAGERRPPNRWLGHTPTRWPERPRPTHR